MLPQANRAQVDGAGASLFDVLRVAAPDGPRLDAKVYIVGLRQGGRVARVAIIGSADPTACELSRQLELSTLLVEDEASGSIFSWLEKWYSDIWDHGMPYTPPPSPQARSVAGAFEPLPFQQSVLDWLDDRWKEAPKDPVRVLQGDATCAFPDI